MAEGESFSRIALKLFAWSAILSSPLVSLDGYALQIGITVSLNILKGEIGLIDPNHVERRCCI
jgi:hypothetical protein